MSPNPTSKKVIRAARRMASSLHAELIGAHVESAAGVRARDRARLAENMRLVESLGGDPVTLAGEDGALELVRYARKRNVTKIVVGKPMHSRWRDVLRQPFLDQVVRASEEIDVHVFSGLEDRAEREREREGEDRPRPAPLSGYLAAIAVAAASTALAWAMFGRSQLADVVMVFLLGVVIVSMRLGFGPSPLATMLSILAYDYFFIPPFLTLSVTDLRHTLTFAVMFVVAVTISHLTRRIREQAERARLREARTASLYAMSRELATAQSREVMLASAARHLGEVFSAHVAVLAQDARGELAPAEDEIDLIEKDLGVAQWVWTHQKPAGAGTDTLPSARALFLPLRGSRGRAGVLALRSERLGDVAPQRAGEDDERLLLHTFAGLIGSALERFQLAEEARRVQLRMETEQLRNALLSSVSHDLRTPLAVVTGATSALLEPRELDAETRRELLETAHGEALRLSRLVHDLLDMTRLEAGSLRVHRELQPIEEVIGAALNRLDDRLAEREVITRLPGDLPLVPIDAALVEQVLINLLENALKYTPAESPLEISAHADGGALTVSVADRGPGAPADDRERVFEKFYRGREREGGGVGLGLTICRGIIEAHGGRIWVDARDGGGAVFRFTLPLEARGEAREEARA